MVETPFFGASDPDPRRSRRFDQGPGEFRVARGLVLDVQERGGESGEIVDLARPRALVHEKDTVGDPVGRRNNDGSRVEPLLKTKAFERLGGLGPDCLRRLQERSDTGRSARHVA